MLRGSVYVLFCFLVATGNEIESPGETRCTRFFLPEEKAEFEEHVIAFLDANATAGGQKASTSFCSAGVNPEEEDFDTVKGGVREVLSAWRREREESEEREAEVGRMVTQMRTIAQTLVKPMEWIESPVDCSDLAAEGESKNGVYRIYPFQSSGDLRPVAVFCDMQTDGGGWTVFLTRRKQPEQLSFARNWNDYKEGFGDPESEHWLGNEKLHEMTSARRYALRMEAENYLGEKTWGEWSTFEVGPEDDKYRLKVKDYRPESVYDDIYFRDYDSMLFSTLDQDNGYDEFLSCGYNKTGGWWYNLCGPLNPTGVYGNREQEGLAFAFWTKRGSSSGHARSLQFKIRPTH